MFRKTTLAFALITTAAALCAVPALAQTSNGYVGITTNNAKANDAAGKATTTQTTSTPTSHGEVKPNPDYRPAVGSPTMYCENGHCNSLTAKAENRTATAINRTGTAKNTTATPINRTGTAGRK